ncbi:CSEP0030 putative effector protein [Blumeria hordei DH14]|uniref:CSEP0030 putative effector protein n=1 Tax=Blumeria graminis f. sp. hordei (strain DH14) TaxID=546991 RepID=N1J9Y1_BLUG1|nr:CSEP0030 putative effector protein [Blumeria hordei DH14]
MRLSNLAIIIYAARFISAASNYKTAHIEEERKGFICNGEYFYEAQYSEDRVRALKIMEHSHMTPISAEKLNNIFEAEQPQRLMMYDNGDAKEHYVFLLPNLANVVRRESHKLEREYNLVLDDSGRVCALIVWNKKITPNGQISEEPTLEICSVRGQDGQCRDALPR